MDKFNDKDGMNIPECSKTAVLMQSSSVPHDTPQVQGNLKISTMNLYINKYIMMNLNYLLLIQ